MKSLNLTRPLVLLIIGIPGAGKSFFARQFSDTFGAPTVSIDRLRFELFETPTFSAEEQDLLMRLMNYQIEELLKAKRTFLIDGFGNAKIDRMHIQKLAKKADFDTLAIWVQTDEPTAQYRSTKRNSRKQDDAYNKSLTPEQYQMLAKKFTAPTLENYTVISGKHTYPSQAKNILRKLAAPREAKAQEIHKGSTPAQRPQPRRNVIIR